jgi:uncharacterized membrane protein YcaP (DUF421 family)
MHPISSDLFVPGIPILEKVFRTVIVYAFLLIGLRVAGKREMGQFNPFDLVVLLVLSNTVQNAIIGNDNSLIGGLLGASFLLVLNYAVVRFLFSHPKLDRTVEGDSLELVLNGEILRDNLKRELITEGELMAAARKQGIDSLKEVACARLEIGGAVTFVVNKPTEDEMRFRRLMEKLEGLERRMERLAGM